MSQSSLDPPVRVNPAERLAEYFAPDDGRDALRVLGGLLLGLGFAMAENFLYHGRIRAVADAAAGRASPAGPTPALVALALRRRPRRRPASAATSGRAKR